MYDTIAWILYYNNEISIGTYYTAPMITWPQYISKNIFIILHISKANKFSFELIIYTYVIISFICQGLEQMIIPSTELEKRRLLSYAYWINV